MDAFLSIIFILAIPAAFGFGIAYFFALGNFKDTLIKEMPEAWKAARAKARPLESWAPTAYKFLRSKDGSLGVRSDQFIAAKKRAVLLLYVSIISFMAILISGLWLDAIS